jgi:hypothetical protein
MNLWSVAECIVFWIGIAILSKTHLIPPGMQMISNPVGTSEGTDGVYFLFSPMLKINEFEFVEAAPSTESVGAVVFLSYLPESRTFSPLKTRTYGHIATSYRNPALRKDPRIVNGVLVGS